jgi:hypothetical protein
LASCCNPDGSQAGWFNQTASFAAKDLSGAFCSLLAVIEIVIGSGRSFISCSFHRYAPVTECAEVDGQLVLTIHFMVFSTTLVSAPSCGGQK